VTRARLVVAPRVDQTEDGVDVWYDDHLVATIYPRAGAGVRVVSQYPITSDHDPHPPNTLTVTFHFSKRPHGSL